MGECISDDRRAQVPDVHLFRDVRRAVVDDDTLRGRSKRDAEPVVTEHRRQVRRQILGPDREVDETHPCQLGGKADVLDLEVAEQLLCDLPR